MGALKLHAEHGRPPDGIRVYELLGGIVLPLRAVQLPAKRPILRSPLASSEHHTRKAPVHPSCSFSQVPGPVQHRNPSPSRRHCSHDPSLPLRRCGSWPSSLNRCSALSAYAANSRNSKSPLWTLIHNEPRAMGPLLRVQST